MRFALVAALSWALIACSSQSERSTDTSGNSAVGTNDMAAAAACADGYVYDFDQHKCRIEVEDDSEDADAQQVGQASTSTQYSELDSRDLGLTLKDTVALDGLQIGMPFADVARALMQRGYVWEKVNFHNGNLSYHLEFGRVYDCSNPPPPTDAMARDPNFSAKPFATYLRRADLMGLGARPQLAPVPGKSDFPEILADEMKPHVAGLRRPNSYDDAGNPQAMWCSQPDPHCVSAQVLATIAQRYGDLELRLLENHGVRDRLNELFDRNPMLTLETLCTMTDNGPKPS